MNRRKAKSLVERFFKDSHGNWAIIQMPNVPLIAWIILFAVNFFVKNQHLAQLQDAVLFTWAYLELTDGVSYFRKTLGAIVLVGLTISFFL